MDDLYGLWHSCQLGSSEYDGDLTNVLEDFLFNKSTQCLYDSGFKEFLNMHDHEDG